MKAWQEAASLMLAVRHGQTYGRAVSPAITYNYKLLCLKRHQKSSFMPGLYVFPGGTVDPADANLKWREHFATFGLDNKLASLVPKTTSRPLIFRSRENELLREISLRITAIRETFEECGVLICRCDKDSGAPSGWAEHISIPDGELQTWQNKIHNDAKEFFNLCQRLECYPDLWALHEWKDWLTPTTVYRKRFDTAFYLACMQDVPHAEYEAMEMEDLKWDTPGKFSSMGIMFPPPQQFEIAHLTKVQSIDDLLDIAVKHNREGMKLYLPICVQLKDGIGFVLPGDAMYPKEISLVEEQVIDKSDITQDEFNTLHLIKNRSQFFDSKVKVIFTHNGEDNCVEFPQAGYPKKSNTNEETKNKL